MKANVGGIDRILRLVFGPALILLGLLVMKVTALKKVFIFIGAMLFVTGLSRFCGPYVLLGIDTSSQESGKKKGKKAT